MNDPDDADQERLVPLEDVVAGLVGGAAVGFVVGASVGALAHAWQTVSAFVLGAICASLFGIAGAVVLPRIRRRRRRR